MDIRIWYIIYGIGILIAGYFLIKALKRIVKGIRNYRKLGKEEFMKRLIEGAEKITPTQKTRAELSGLIISQIGIICGLIVLPIIRLKNIWWWGEILLVGAFIIGLFGILGKWQLYRIQKKQDDIMKELELNQEQEVTNANQ